jgi:hypothetical protein
MAGMGNYDGILDMLLLFVFLFESLATDMAPIAGLGVSCEQIVLQTWRP